MLAIRKQVLGEKHPDYANSLNILAVYTTQGNYAKAEPLFVRRSPSTKKFWERSTPTTPPASTTWPICTERGTTPRRSRSFARRWRSQEGPGREAPRLRHQPQQPGRAVPSKGTTRRPSPSTAGAGDPQGSAGREASRLRRQPQQPGLALPSNGGLREGGAALRQALAHPQEVLGEEHPAYANSLNNLALLYRAPGEYAKAEPLFRRRSRSAKRCWARSTPTTPTASTTWPCYTKTRGTTRRPSRSTAGAAIRKEVLGEKHPDYATSLNNLAGLYGATEEYAKAEPLFRQALAIRKKAGREASRLRH